MPDELSHARVKKLRERRQASGEVETNVWMPAGVREAIDRAVKSGKYPSRRVAIVRALEQAFTETTPM